jgi:hypothetical protein
MLAGGETMPTVKEVNIQLENKPGTLAKFTEKLDGLGVIIQLSDGAY